MARYRKIDTRIWNDAKFNALSEPGKLVFFFVLTHPNLTMLGAMRATIPGLAAELGIGAEAFVEAFQEILARGMARHDEEARFFWLPNFLKYNKPESPNVVRSWFVAFDLLPECAMKCALVKQLKAYVEGLSKGFRDAFTESFAKGMSKQEQEQDYISPAMPAIEKSSSSKHKSPRKAKIPEPLLLEIYEAYPRHVGKEDALKAIQKAITRIAPSRDTVWLLERTRAFAQHRKGEDEKFTPYPATWFNKNRYEDESLAPKRESELATESSAFAHPSRVINLDSVRAKVGMI